MTSTIWHPQREARKPLPYVSWDDLSIILEMEKHRGNISLAKLKEKKKKYLKDKMVGNHCPKNTKKTVWRFFQKHSPQKSLGLLAKNFRTFTVPVLVIT